MVLTLSPTVVSAHTGAELDAWLTSWEYRVTYQHDDPMNLYAEYQDMADRHPCYFKGDCPRPASTRTTPHRTAAAPAGVEQWRSLVARFFPADQVDRALRVMACESGGNPNADNPRSSAAGLFQHLGKYWPERSAAAGYGGASIYDPEANVATAAWLLRQNGWGSWVCR